MAWVRGLIHGSQFSIELNGEAEIKGFFTTRFVEAEGFDQAEGVALAALKAEPFFSDEAMLKRSPKAKIEFEEIVELKGRPPKTGIWPFRRFIADGFSFYHFDEEKEE
jgi:hypothetical protein